MPDKEQDFPCLKCDYNLRGLEDDGRCPECGLEIKRSLDGNLFFYSSRKHLVAVRRGVFLVFTGFILQIIALLVYFVVGTFLSRTRGGMEIIMSFNWINNFIHPCLSFIILIGWWRLTAPDPSIVGTNTGWKARLAIRLSTTISMLVLLLSFTIVVVRSYIYAITIGMAGFVAILVTFFSVLIYLRWLTLRLPDKKLFRDATIIMWMVPRILLFILLVYILMAFFPYFAVQARLVAMMAITTLLFPLAMFLIMLNDIRSILSGLLKEKKALE